MAKNKVSEWSSTPSNNTDIANIDIAEGCAPSGVNNAIREMMAQVKDMQAGLDGDPFVVSGSFTAQGEVYVNGSEGTANQVMTSRGSGLSPIWKDAFVAGMIMLWSGSIASVPSGWALCDGSSGRPDLRNRFVVGAGSTYAVNATGGSADAIVVSHTHSATSSVTDPGHTHTMQQYLVESGADVFAVGSSLNQSTFTSNSNTTGISVSTSITSTGSSGTNANLPPYFALAYIIKL